MPTNGQTVPCNAKQVIKKYIREVPCPRVQPKRKQDDPCTAMECKKQAENRKNSKCIRRPEKLLEPCSTGNGYSTSASGCPKCEENRIQRLECEVFQLRREIEHMKHERKEAEKALQKAILRGACALGGGYKTHVPESIEKLLNNCDSNVSACSSLSVTFCSTKPPSNDVHHYCVKTAKKKHECCSSIG